MENVLADLRELTKGMDMIRKEYEGRSRKDHKDQPLILKDFLNNSEDKLQKLNGDAKTAQVGK